MIRSNWLLVLPGDPVRRRLGISAERDCGVVGGFIPMCVRGVTTLLIAPRNV